MLATLVEKRPVDRTVRACQHEWRSVAARRADECWKQIGSRLAQSGCETGMLGCRTRETGQIGDVLTGLRQLGRHESSGEFQGIPRIGEIECVAFDSCFHRVAPNPG